MSRALMLFLLNCWAVLVLPVAHAAADAGANRTPAVVGWGTTTMVASASGQMAATPVDASTPSIAADVPGDERHHPAECALCRAAEAPALRSAPELPLLAGLRLSHTQAAPPTLVASTGPSAASARAPPGAA